MGRRRLSSFLFTHRPDLLNGTLRILRCKGNDLYSGDFFCVFYMGLYSEVSRSVLKNVDFVGAVL